MYVWNISVLAWNYIWGTNARSRRTHVLMFCNKHTPNEILPYIATYLNTLITFVFLLVHGGWGVWSSWGICSTSCGIGLQRRDRACDSPWPSKDGNHCFGESSAYEICADLQCNGENAYYLSHFIVFQTHTDMDNL